MSLFIIGLVILVVGYFVYGKFIEKIFQPDNRETPAKRLKDGVDFVELPHWKNMLIQILNIAGIGPVIGVIIGIKFGAIVFLIIPIGNIIGGAVHDLASGMMSIRNDGMNLPGMIQKNLGKLFGTIFTIFMIAVLLLVVAVFINIPAGLTSNAIYTHIDSITKGSLFWIAVAVIFIYYIIATLFPVDKIIGYFYPVFGALLLIGTLAIFVELMRESINDPSLLIESDSFKLGKFDLEKTPILPMLFVTIACGIISGFHATQSPIIARTMKTEFQARSTFYGMMVLEGFIAMVWAAAALAFFNMNPEIMKEVPNTALSGITTHFLGKNVGTITIISVIILAITSGDTAMRSLRLSIAEKFKISQLPLKNRFIICIPLIILISLLLWWSNQNAKTFNILWNYFAWSNQVLAVCTLMAATVYLIKLKRNFVITLIPGLFMCFIVLTYILWISPAKGGPIGFGLPINIAYILSIILSVLCGGYIIFKERNTKK